MLSKSILHPSPCLQINPTLLIHPASNLDQLQHPPQQFWANNHHPVFICYHNIIGMYCDTLCGGVGEVGRGGRTRGDEDGNLNGGGTSERGLSERRMPPREYLSSSPHQASLKRRGEGLTGNFKPLSSLKSLHLPSMTTPLTPLTLAAVPNNPPNEADTRSTIPPTFSPHAQNRERDRGDERGGEEMTMIEPSGARSTYDSNQSPSPCSRAEWTYEVTGSELRSIHVPLIHHLPLSHLISLLPQSSRR
jgi:hypothetical protein